MPKKGDIIKASEIGFKDGTVQTNLNADLLDGVDSSKLLRNDQNGSLTGTLTVSGDVKAASFTVGSNQIIETDGLINWNKIKSAPAAYTPAAHNHDDRYYTETEMDGKLRIMTAYEHAQFVMQGGGTITWNTTNGVKWTTRFILIPVDKSNASAGYVDITFPAAGTNIQIEGAGTVASTANGIPLGTWQSLYWVHTLGGGNGTGSFRIVDYSGATTNKIEPNWILVAARNNDAETIRLGTGQILANNATIVNGKFSTNNIDGLDTALGAKAPLASPALTGVPTAPTPATTSNDTTIATTAFVKAQSYLTGNQSITLSGDVSGTGTTAITTTLSATGVAAGTYAKVTVDTKGRVTAGEALSSGDIPSIPSSNVTGLGTAAVKNVGTADGEIPILGTGGKLNASVLPALAITDTFVVATEAAMLGLAAQVGDVAVRTDLNKSFILKTDGANVLGNWQELLTPTDTVTSVAGKTGAVTLVKGDVGLGNVDNESKATMFASPAFTGIPTAPTATAGTNTTQLATTEFVTGGLNTKANSADVYTKTQLNTSGGGGAVHWNNVTNKPTYDNYGSWTLKINTDAGQTVGSGGAVDLKGSGATSITRSGNTITISSTDTNTDTNNYLTSVSGSGNGTVTFTRGGTSTLSNLTWDASHNHDDRYTRGVSKDYSSVTGDDGTDGWYTLFTVNDSQNSPILCHIKAYAHTSASFIVSKGYDTSHCNITLLNVVRDSINGTYKYLKGIRILTNGTVQIKLNGGATTQISAQLLGSSASSVAFAATLVKDTTTLPAAVGDTIDPLVNLSMRSKGDIYVDASKVWHAGSFDPSLKANLASPALTGTPTAPTPAAASNDTTIATTAFVKTGLAGKSDTGHNHSLSGLTDTTITAPAAGHFLEWDGSKWINNLLVAGDIPSLDATKIGSGTFDIARIPTGTTATTVAFGNHNHTLDSLSNVSTSGKTNGQVLKWNGTNWVHATLAASDIPDATTAQKGVVQLSDSTSSTSTALAATANAVKTAYDLAAGKEPAFTKNTAFNKNFGTTAGTVAEGNHNHAGVYQPAGSYAPSHPSGYLPLSGGTMTGPITSSHSNPLISTLPGRKSWILHHPGSNQLIFAPSATVDGTDWDWTKQIVFGDNGDVTAKSFTVGGTTVIESDARVDWNKIKNAPSYQPAGSYAPTSHTHPITDITWAGGQNLSLTGTANGQEWSIDMPNVAYTGMYWQVWSGKLSATALRVDNDTGLTTAARGLAVTGNATISGNITFGNYIYGAYGTVIKSTDEWLRINEDGTHTSGTYFGSTTVRTDDQFQVGSGGSAFKATSGGVVTASVSVTAPTVSANQVEVKSTSNSSKFTIEYNETENAMDFVFS